MPRRFLDRWRENKDAIQEVKDMTQAVFLSLFEDDGKALRAWDPTRGSPLESFVEEAAQDDSGGIGSTRVVTEVKSEFVGARGERDFGVIARVINCSLRHYQPALSVAIAEHSVRFRDRGVGIEIVPERSAEDLVVRGPSGADCGQ